jgi:hypothetical protein
VRRLCERPGCAGPAEVSYGIDHVSLVVWVDNTAVSERELAGRLCRRHANALVVPRGWTIDDRRDAVPKLFRVDDEKVVESKPKTKKPSVKKESTESPSLFEAAAEAVPPVVEEVSPPVDPDETQAIPWLPRLGAEASDAPETKDDEEAPVFGRLLGRAFGQKKSP